MENIVQTADDATYFAGWHTAWLNDEGHSDWIKFEDAEYSHFRPPPSWSAGSGPSSTEPS